MDILKRYLWEKETAWVSEHEVQRNLLFSLFPLTFDFCSLSALLIQIEPSDLHILTFSRVKQSDRSPRQPDN